MASPPPPPLRLAVVGGRSYRSYETLSRHADAWIAEFGEPSEIVSGGARGADALAARFAAERGYALRVFRPEDTDIGGAAALLARNTLIAERATHVLAFPTPASRGTWDTVRKARDRGKPVRVVRVDGGTRTKA